MGAMSSDFDRLRDAGLGDEQAALVLEGRLPRPVWLPGDDVRVVPNERNTERRGTIRLVIWHHKQQQWMYYIRQSGRAVSKRYWAVDLEGG